MLQFDDYKFIELLVTTLKIPLHSANYIFV